ncbi:alpha/beta hydrolase family protein [Acidobacteriota bacterium]
MKKSIITLCVGTMILSVMSFSLPEEKKKGIEGYWLGVLDVGTPLRIGFNITIEQDGSLKATMDSPDQGAKDLSVDSATFENSTLTIVYEQAGLRYTATYSEETDDLKGTLEQAGMKLELNMKKVDEPPRVFRPQDPSKPYPYREEEVSYENAEGGITLTGTLTMPKEGGGPFPAVILITGSGAQNRDEEIMGHRPFLVLADYLTRRGIAVLRVDDRGVGGSTGDISESTSEDFAGDVLAGVKYLKGLPEIDQKKIGLCGHSEGGIIAPIAASRSKDVAFIVLMAGTGLTGEEILYLQGALIARASGVPEDKIQENIDDQKRIFAVVNNFEDPEIIKAELKKLFDEDLKTMSEEDRGKMAPDPETAFKVQVKQVLSKWFRYFLKYDPKTALREVKCPVLAINGTLDLQVPYKENLEAIEDALKEGGNTDYTLKELPGLNHLFQKALTGAPTEYVKISETINPAALQTIGDWIQARVK